MKHAAFCLSLFYGLVRLAAQPGSCAPIVNTDVNHTIILANFTPTLNGSPLPHGSYIIVLYDKNGAPHCAGAVQWTGVNTALAAFGNDALTPEKDGFIVGDTFRYRVELPDGTVWDEDCISVEYATGGIYFNAGTFAVNGISGLSALMLDTVACSVQCPVLGLDIGDFCDDHDDTTLSDIVTDSCTCAGMPSSYRLTPFVVASAGAYQVFDSMQLYYSLAWTLGQIAAETWGTMLNSNTCYWLRQGFQQPFEWKLPEPPAVDCTVITALETPEGPIGVRLFPNPVSGALTIDFDAAFPHELAVFSPQGGRLVFRKSAAARDELAFEALPAGMYILTVTDARTGRRQSFKLVKN